jgi:hypothetical protein
MKTNKRGLLTGCMIGALCVLLVGCFSGQFENPKKLVIDFKRYRGETDAINIDSMTQELLLILKANNNTDYFVSELKKSGAKCYYWKETGSGKNRYHDIYDYICRYEYTRFVFIKTWVISIQSGNKNNVVNIKVKIQHTGP